MEVNIYQAPEADLSKPEIEDSQFYVVSRLKFLTLFFITLGLYEIYWHYRNWQAYSLAKNEDIMPFWRAIFSIFFTHKLFKEFNKKATQSDNNHEFKNNWLATVYVILTILSFFTDIILPEAIDSASTDIAGYAIFLFLGLILLKAQKTANIASGDPEGENNSNFSAANFLWIFIGACLWITLIASYTMSENLFAKI